MRYKITPSIKLLLTLFLFINTPYVFSQNNAPLFNKLNVQGATFNKKINTLFEDSLGFLWIGTSTGLYRYDGNELIAFKNNVFNEYSIPNNNINSITEDNNQNLWIGSESFLIFYNRKQNKFKGFNKNATSIVYKKTSNNVIWTFNVKSNNLKNFIPTDQHPILGLPTKINYHTTYKINNTISCFTEDSYHRYWMGSPNGIYTIDSQNNYVKTNFKTGVIKLKNVDQNKLLALTNQGIYVLGYNKTNYTLEILESYPNILDPFKKNDRLTDFSTISNNKNNQLWIGTNSGLIKASRKDNKYTFKYYPQEDLEAKNINSTIFDSYGNLWIGSNKGISKLISRNSLFSSHDISEHIKNKNPNALNIQFSNEKNILVGTTNGIYKYKNNSFKEVKISSSPNIKNINTIVEDYNKKELFIANNNQLFKTTNYNPSIYKLTLKKVKNFNKSITAIAPINKNETWIGLWDGGIDIINEKTPLSDFKKSVIKQLSGNHTSVFSLTSDYQLWIGTRGEGLYRIDLNNESLHKYLPSKKGLSSNAILSLYEDSKHNIWIGTRGGGLNLYLKKENNFKNYNKENSRGISPNTIISIEEDFKGNIWMSTLDGITLFDVPNEKFVPFGTEDGIKENHFIYGASSSNHKKDKLFFVNRDGFYTVYPNKFSQKNKIPTTVITNFSVLNNSKNNTENPHYNHSDNININSEEPIILPYNSNNIVLNFSSLDLTTPNKNEYAYKLDGLNNYWVYTNASNRNANYNDLPPGSYTFKVKSSNSDGVWNSTPTVLHFKITPPFWRSTIAHLIYGLLCIILILISYLLINRWYRLKKNLVTETISREKDNEHNRMKMIFFTDISHELRTPLSLILGTIEKVVKEKNFSLSPLTAQRIYNNTLRMHRLINQIMDIRKFDVGKFNLSISKNDIVKDVSIIKDSFNDFARIYEIKYDFITKQEKIKGWYDVDILEKTLFNLLSNAFKYTKEKGAINVTLELASNNDPKTVSLDLEKDTYIKCAVRDNGMGIPKKDLPFIFDRYYQATKSYSNQIPGTGVGMELVHKLIERHQGIIMVESEENIFTEFTFYLPINKDKYPKKERIKTGMPLKRNFIQNSEYQVIEEVSSEFESKKSTKKSAKPTILLVEDNEDLRRMVKDELISDFNVLEAPNGKVGYDIIVKEKPLLIISDILMPIEDGISMLQRIKTNKEISNIPIFMLTAKNSEDTKIKCLSLGADDYIEKPFSLEFVKWKVKNALGTRKELKEKYSKVITAEPSKIKIDSNDEKFIKKLIKIIEDSMTDNLLSVEYLASEVGMSRANLYRKLQAIANDTPVNFIKKIKLKRAAQLLKQNNMYISEVAYMTGFNNQKYFGKCFQKEYGMSPTEYIKQHSSQNDKDEI